jgi:putative protease
MAKAKSSRKKAAPARKKAAKPKAAKPKAAKPKAAKPAPKPAAKKSKSGRGASKSAPAAKRSPRPTLPPVLPWRLPQPGETLVGVVDDYFSKVGVITLTLRAPVALGDRLSVRGHTTDVSQLLTSMQIEHKAVQRASTGDGIGVKIDGKSRRGDYVFRAD